MANEKSTTDIRSGRLSDQEIANNFKDIHKPLARPEALIEADRCYFCFDAPCITACPTDIDIPAFIQKIRSDNIRGSAHTILEANIMGGMCARVCPTEVLCEEACVRNTHADRPVNIGLLQRYATDPIYRDATPLFTRGVDSGKKVAVVGAGPAGLSCAHRLSMLGHRVVIYSRDRKAGGLNEYGIAAYKTVDEFAQKEIEYILSIGGIDLRPGVVLGRDTTLAALREQHDAVFLAVGLGAVRQLGIDNEDADGVIEAVDYIAELRQAENKARMPVGRRIVVIGGGMTAIDIAVQSKRLGAEQVDIVYRRGPDQMGASKHEQAFAQTNGVTIRHWARPRRIDADGELKAIEFARTELDVDGKLVDTGDTWSLEADVIFKAVGQITADDVLLEIEPELVHEQGKLVVDENRRTTLSDVWAGGDCVHGGDDLTVSAVQDGKIAAMAIDQYLR